MRYILTFLCFIFSSGLIVGQSSFEEIISFEGALTDQEAKILLGESIAFYPYQFSINRLEINRPGVWIKVIANNGICGEEWIYHFDVQGNVLHKKKYGESCDHDGSNPFYSYLEGEIVYPEPIIEIITKNEQVVDTIFLARNRNEFKDGYSFYDSRVESEIEVFYEYFGINENGSFYKICEDSTKKEYRRYPFTYYRLLGESELSMYDQKELRIMRNEIFADYGYVFRSKDLNEYFHSQSWYSPNNKGIEEIIEEMNLIEKRNIQLIRRLEQKKKK